MIEIDEALLIKLAGAGAFGRGLHCFEERRISGIESTESKTTAIVIGCHQYNVCLRHTHRMLEGACDCPASDGIDFCQHCVAVALVLQKGQAPTKPTDKRTALRAIRRHWSQRTREELIEELISLAGQDRELRNDLLEKVQFAYETMSYTKLRKMIKQIMPIEDLWEFRAVRRYFQGVASMLVRITEIADQLPPLVLLRAVEYAIRRLDIVLEYIDDSGDCREESAALLQQLHLTAMNRLDWTPRELASYLVDLCQFDSWHPFQYEPDLYPDQLGDAIRVAICAEIESRLAGLAKLSAGGAPDLKDNRRLLTQLQEQLDAAFDDGHK